MGGHRGPAQKLNQPLEKGKRGGINPVPLHGGKKKEKKTRRFAQRGGKGGCELIPRPKKRFRRGLEKKGGKKKKKTVEDVPDKRKGTDCPPTPKTTSWRGLGEKTSIGEKKKGGDCLGGKDLPGPVSRKKEEHWPRWGGKKQKTKKKSRGGGRPL